MSTSTRLIALAVSVTVGMLSSVDYSLMPVGLSFDHREKLDKFGTSGRSESETVSQTQGPQGFVATLKNQAEGTGVEPATPCGASDFESDRSPFAYPPGIDLPGHSPLGKGNEA